MEHWDAPARWMNDVPGRAEFRRGTLVAAQRSGVGVVWVGASLHPVSHPRPPRPPLYHRPWKWALTHEGLLALELGVLALELEVLALELEVRPCLAARSRYSVEPLTPNDLVTLRAHMF